MAIVVYILAYFVWMAIFAIVEASSIGQIFGAPFVFVLMLLIGLDYTCLTITAFLALAESACAVLEKPWSVLAFTAVAAAALAIIAVVTWDKPWTDYYGFKKVFYPALGVAVIYVLRGAAREEPTSFHEPDDGGSIPRPPVNHREQMRGWPDRT